MKRGVWLILALYLPLAGCGLALRYKTEEIQLLTPEVTGASCEITDKRGRKWQAEGTPTAITVADGSAPLSIICQKRSYKPAVVMVESMNFWRENDHIPLSGASLKEISGGRRYYPQVVEVWMELSTWKEEEEHKEWLIRRARSRLADVQVLVNPNHAKDNTPLPPSPQNSYWQAEEAWVEWVKGL